MLPDEAVEVVRTVVALLIAGEYEELETLTEGRRLTARMMADAVREYGRDLVPPPDGAYAGLEAIELDTGEEFERAFHVDVPLWTAQEGRSDLGVQLTVAEVMAGAWTVELVGVRVL